MELSNLSNGGNTGHLLNQHPLAPNCDVIVGTSTLENGDCSDEGVYDVNLECQDYFGAVQIKPYKNTDPLNGVSSFDLVLISRHILQLQLLDSPYKMIAADINKNGSITTLDMVDLRKLILFIDTEFQDNDSWRFVDAGYVFPNPTNPFQEVIPECIALDLQSSNPPSSGALDFVAVKIGNVIGTLNCELFTGDADNRDAAITLNCLSKKVENFKVGEFVDIDLFIQSEEELVSWEMGMHFNSQFLEFVEVNQPEDGQVGQEGQKYFGTTKSSEGKLRALWYSPDGTSIPFDGKKLSYSLRFKVLKSIENLSDYFNQDDMVLENVAYDETGAPYNILMNLTKDESAKQSKLFSDFSTIKVVKNPFRNKLVLQGEFPESKNLEVSIFNMMGQEVAFWNGLSVDGLQNIVFEDTKLWESGVYIWQIKAEEELISGKVIKQ